MTSQDLLIRSQQQMIDDLKENINILRNIIRDNNEMLLDVVNQSCSDNGVIDNRCLSSYEAACEYLHRNGLLDKTNDRIFKLRD